MKIRMFNCYFGDCFRIENNNGDSLYVDFGIHANSLTSSRRQKIYKAIIGQMMNGQDDFLLTHYHEDHYSGAVYMMRNKLNQFRNVYIPDIWEINGSIYAIQLTLLRGLIVKSVLQRNLSLIQFLKNICYSSGKIYFVKRGTIIQNKYITLWPDENYIGKRAEGKLASYEEGEMWERLVSISVRLQKVVIEAKNQDRREDRLLLMPEFDRLETDYRNLAEEFKNKINRTYKLGQFGNEISIIFQNKYIEDRNILFTGDMNGKENWKFIETNKDGKAKMHGKYDVLKIPHHGTKSCYHSFLSRSNSNTIFLIPSGKISRSSSWHIASAYTNDIALLHCAVVCSDNNACETKSLFGSCQCRNYSVIGYMNFFIDI